MDLPPFTVAKSRYNHYLMPVFPALALASALLIRVLPRWRAIAAAAFTLAAFIAHIVPFAHNPEGDDEIAALAGLMASSSRPDDVLFVVDQYSFSARFHVRRHTVEVHMKRG